MITRSHLPFLTSYSGSHLLLMGGFFVFVA
nr:MAG TPA: hypothetical protein [Caudoviricetes sp.]